MGFYQDEIVPILINLTMRRRDLAAYRSRVVPSADGRVLEIGIGSGLNLPFYSRNVERLIGLEVVGLTQVEPTRTSGDRFPSHRSRRRSKRHR